MSLSFKTEADPELELDAHLAALDQVQAIRVVALAIDRLAGAEPSGHQALTYGLQLRPRQAGQQGDLAQMFIEEGLVGRRQPLLHRLGNRRLCGRIAGRDLVDSRCDRAPTG